MGKRIFFVCSFDFERTHFISFFTENEVHNFCMSLMKKDTTCRSWIRQSQTSALDKRFPYYWKQLCQWRFTTWKFADGWQCYQYFLFCLRFQYHYQLSYNYLLQVFYKCIHTKYNWNVEEFLTMKTINWKT